MYVVTRGYPIPVSTKFIICRQRLSRSGPGVYGLHAAHQPWAYILLATVFGNRLKAIGGNELVARLRASTSRQQDLHLRLLACWPASQGHHGGAGQRRQPQLGPELT
jgi:hypothetical protein